jgi:hypothetical protein
MSEVQAKREGSESGEPEKKRRISCDYPGCEKSFLRSEHLSRHQLNHYGRTLECDQCGKKFARSDLLHRHLDRHRQQAQKIHNQNGIRGTPSPTRSISSPYGGHHRTIRSLSADDIPRSMVQDHSPGIMSQNHYVPNQQVQPILPAPHHGPNGMGMQQCISPMSMVSSMTLHPDYPQPMYHDIHQSHSNSPVNGHMVVPPSPNPNVLDPSTRWDHLFQGGGIFETSSIFGIDSEFSQLTPPDLSINDISVAAPPYQTLLSAAPTPTLGEFTVSGMAIEKIRAELPEYFRQQRFLSSPNTLAILLEKAFFHLHSNFPIFHRPTMQIETFPPFLVLAIASLGALLSDDQESQIFGLTLHNYVRDFVFSPMTFSGNREVWVLQTMLIVNITGNHLGKRMDHEMSDILQGTMVTVQPLTKALLIAACPSQ